MATPAEGVEADTDTQPDNLIPVPVEPDAQPEPQPDAQPDADAQTEAATPPKPGPPAPKPADGVDWRAMARKWEKRAKENADARKRLDEVTDASKTELDRMRESVQALQAENESNRLRAMKADVASQTGVPAELLSATTEEDLADQAEAIMEFVKAKSEAETATRPAPKPAPAKPKEKLRSGAQGGGTPEPSREDILAAVLGRGRKRK